MALGMPKTHRTWNFSPTVLDTVALSTLKGLELPLKHAEVSHDEAVFFFFLLTLQGGP